MLHVHDFVLPLHANSDPPPRFPGSRKLKRLGTGLLMREIKEKYRMSCLAILRCSQIATNCRI